MNKPKYVRPKYWGITVTEEDKLFYEGSRFVLNIGLIDVEKLPYIAWVKKYALKRFMAGMHEPDITIQLCSRLGDVDTIPKIVNPDSPYAEGLAEYAMNHKSEYLNLWSLIVGYGRDIRSKISSVR